MAAVALVPPPPDSLSPGDERRAYGYDTQPGDCAVQRGQDGGAFQRHPWQRRLKRLRGFVHLRDRIDLSNEALTGCGD